MRIPIVHKIPKKQNLIINEMPWCSTKDKDASRLPTKFSHLENSIEIEVSPCRESLYLFFLLLLLWLSVVIYLFHAHSAVTAQIHHQRLTVNLLKIEVEELMLEVNVLKNHLSSAASVRGHVDSASKPPLAHSVLSFHRQKRSDAEERRSNMKGPAPLHKKTGGMRRGNQSRSMLKQHRRLMRCCRLFRKNYTKHGGLQAVHFKGAHPEALVEAGRIGPWYMDTKAIVDNEVSSSFQLREDGESVEIKEPGLYLIYAQVYYLTTEAFNSFSIILLPHDSEIQIPIALCSTTINSISSTSEVSCYTAVLRTLKMGDRIIVQQREKHRRLIMRGGHTFLGFAKLSGARATS